MDSYPLAYFITWSCHGTHLHGDKRGSVDDEHNEVYEAPLDTNEARRSWEESILRDPPVTLSAQARRIVKATIEAHCRVRGWAILSLNVRITHVHVVLSCDHIAPEIPLEQFKAWCTRRLREAGVFGKQAKVWTEHGSTRYLWDQPSIDGAVKYVRDRQGKPLV